METIGWALPPGTRAGIDGVKYPVNTMGGAPKNGEGLRFNYVSFRDDNVRVDHKWTDGQQRYSVSRNPDARREAEDALEGVPSVETDKVANSYAEARAVLVPQVGRIFHNKETGIDATLSKNSINKLLSGKAVAKSVGVKEHLSAVANVTTLFENGHLVATDDGSRKGVQLARRFVSRFTYGGEKLVAKTTVLEYERGDQRIYSVEAMEVEKAGSILAPRGSVNQAESPALPLTTDIVPQTGESSQGGEPRHSVRRDELALHDDPQREYDEVVARFTNEDGTRKPGWMKAPNGRPTNLTERQWVQVRTPAFKRWFGDWEGDPANASKVVDENGEPLVVYHGTETGGFSVFNGLKNNSSSFGLEGATFFSTSLETAKTYTSSPKAGDFSPFLADAKKWLAKFRAKTQARWLDSHEWHVVDTDKEIKPPKRRIRVEYQVVTENGTFVPNSDGATVAESIRKAERSVANALMSGEGAMVYSCFIRARNPYVVDFKGKTWRGDVVSGTTLDVARKAIEEGSDCAIIKNVEDSASFLSDDNISDSIAVFSPEQIKSATGNAGAFNAFNTDIRYSVGRAARTAMEEIADGAQSATIANAEVGEIGYPLGAFGEMTDGGRIRHGLGFLHIVYSRMAKDGATLDEAVATAIRVAESAANGEQTRNTGNRIWLDKDGIRAVIARNADGQKVITGYEIYAEEPWTTSRANHGRKRQPTPRLDDVLSALRRSIAYLAPSAQVPDADGFVRDAVMGMLAAAGDGKGAANAGGACQTAGTAKRRMDGGCAPKPPAMRAWKRRSADGRGKATPRRRSIGASAVD